MTFGSLFSGIGGMDLGLEWAGMKCRWQVEIDDYCTKVLERHWPAIRRYRDVREVGEGLEPVDVVALGFPCTDISNIGLKAGITGKQSGLWSEGFRIVRLLRPRYVIVENVAALAIRGLDAVLRDFVSIRYDAEWSPVCACSMGAPHPRQRLFVVAYPSRQQGIHQSDFTMPAQRLFNDTPYWQSCPWNEAEPKICRVDDGIPNRVVRTEKCGNAIVPQVAEWIGKRILEADVA